SLHHELRRNLIHVLDGKRQMDRSRANVPQRERPILGELALNSEIELLIVRTRWILLDVRSAQTRRCYQDNPTNRKSGWCQRWPGCSPALVEWSAVGSVRHHVQQRQDVIDAIARPDRRFAASIGIPHNAKARNEVRVVGIEIAAAKPRICRI